MPTVLSERPQNKLFRNAQHLLRNIFFKYTATGKILNIEE